MKRTIEVIALLVISLHLGFAHSEDSPTPAPEDIIRKAIAARGGEKALAKYLSFRHRVKGLMFNGDESAPMTTVYLHRNYPRSYKGINEVKPPNLGSITETVVFDGKKIWLERNGATREGNDGELRGAQVAAYHVYIRNLFPLLDRKHFSLRTLPPTRIDDKDTVGVRVSSEDYPDIYFFFDKKTWLLVNSGYESKEKTQENTSYEEYYDNYKKMKGGMMYPTKTTVFKYGKKRFELELVDIEPLSGVKDSEFSRP